MTIRGAAVVIVGAWLTALPQVQRTPPPPLQARATGVSVAVSVTRKGKVVQGLRATQFALVDNGVAQEITMQPASNMPVDVSLVVDLSFFSIFRAPGLSHPFDAFSTAVRKMASTLRPDNRLELISFSTTVEWLRPMQPVGSVPVRPSMANQSAGLGVGSSLTDAALSALARPAERGRQYLVVVLSCGYNTSGILPLDRLEPLARRSDAVLYVLFTPWGTRASGGMPRALYPAEVATRNAFAAAAATTGGAASAGGDVVAGFQHQLIEFRDGYILRYTAQGVPSTGWHDITVTVPSCPTCTIHARKGYFGQ